MIHSRYLICAILCLTPTLGCSTQTIQNVAAHGSVTVAKTPLPEGLITFVPCNGTPGKKCSVVITDGRYAFDSAQGLAAGDYRVEIMGLPPGIKSMAEGQPPSHHRTNYREIAPEYNEKSTLHCTLQSSQDNQADFNVQFVR